MTIVYVELSESRKYMKLRISIYDFRVLSQLSHCATWHHACAPSEFWRTCHLFFPSSLRLPPPPHPASNPLPLVPNRPKHHHQRVPHPSPVPFHAAATPNLKHRRNAQIGSPLAAGLNPSTPAIQSLLPPSLSSLEESGAVPAAFGLSFLSRATAALARTGHRA